MFMAIVCGGCGDYIQPEVQVEQQSMRCLVCGHVVATRILPLFIVTGASGAGKTAVVSELRRLLPAWDIFETDVIHGADWQQVKCNWLRIAHAIAQSGRHTILCGTILPADLQQCDHYSFFSKIYFLNLHCDDATRAVRLRARPAWRGCNEPFIEEHRKFAQWLLDYAATEFDPPMPTIETTLATPEEVAKQICEWATAHATANSVY